eukprot:6907904-Lingulodinium_polyedra.AAC.1
MQTSVTWRSRTVAKEHRAEQEANLPLNRPRSDRGSMGENIHDNVQERNNNKGQTQNDHNALTVDQTTEPPR